MTPRTPTLALALLAIASVSIVGAHAATLTLDSGGIVLAQRNYGAPTSCTLTATADTYVRSDQSNSSFGSQSTLLVSNSSSSTTRILVRFDLAECSPAIPPDAIVHSATIQLTMASLLTVGPRSYDLRRATSGWTESTTWSNQPAVSSSVTSSATVTLLAVVGTQVEWSVVGDVQAMVAGDVDNHGWRMSDSVEGVTPLLSAQLSFNSREAASGRPQLVITYAP